MVRELAEEREAEMFGLVVRFAMWVCKRAAHAQEETTPGLKFSSGKCSRLSRLDEEVQVDPVVITVDSLEGVLEAPSAVEGVAQDACQKASAALEDETTAKELPRILERP